MLFKSSRFFCQRKAKSLSLMIVCCVLSLSALPNLIKSKPALGADKINASYGALELSLPVDTLETYVVSGQITPEFQPYTQLFDAQSLAEMRQLLQQKFTISSAGLSRFLDAPMGKMILLRLGQIIKTEPGQDGAQMLKVSLIGAAGDPKGLTLLTLLRHFPGDTIRINAVPLLAAKQELTVLSKYRDAALKAIAQEADAEIASEPAADFSRLPDLRQPGPFKISHRILDLSNNRNRQSLLGKKIGLRFEADLYLPVGQSQPAPIVVISHGLGSGRSDFVYLAEHLASYGFAVAVPEHIGSNAQRLQSLLDGSLQKRDVSPVEFIDRPLDVKYLLDELERLSQSDPTLKGQLNLQQVGMMGHSLGGYTTLALAGAELNHERLDQACGDQKLTLNISLFLQCRAQGLPPFNYNLYDPRIKAAISLTPLTSSILGPESIGKIRIPTMVISGSSDFVTPAIPEQIYPFLWLNTSDKFLVMLTPNGHNFAAGGVQQPSPFSSLSQLLAGPNPKLSQEYVKALSLAFMQTYVANRSDYRKFLSAAYTKTLSREPIKLALIRSLTPDQLKQAFGGPLPLPVVQPLTTAASPTRSETVLQEIQRTGVLKASIRQDALPFAFIDAKGQGTGYCLDLLTGLANQLQQQLNRDIRLEIAVPSSLENRFEVVKNNVAQVECGPNTITRNPASGTQFSTPFFITGTHFLVKKSAQVNPQSNLQNLQIGIFSLSTTATFMQRTYPRTKLVSFQGEMARSDALQALNSNQIDALANDGILLISQLERQKLSLNEYTLIPELPLTCDAYGMILPADDQQWQTTVNQFIDSQRAKRVWDQWFNTLYPYVLLNIDYCADR